MPAPTTSAKPDKPKGAVGIWIGVLLIVGGIILAIALVVVGVRSLVDGFDGLQQVPLNGGGVVEIEDTGTQTVYAERYTSETGSSFNTGTASFSNFGPAITVQITGPDNQPIEFQPLSGSETYVHNHREGVRIGQFEAATPGRYRIDPAGEPNGYQSVAVGSGLKVEGIGAILGGVFGGGLVVLIGIILVIVFAVRRSRSKKQIAQGSSPYPSPYGAAAAGWPVAPGPAGYATPGVPGGYGAPGAPGAPAPGAWPPAGGTNPGWVPPPVAQPSPGWTPPVAPPPPPAPSGTGTPWQSPPPAAPEPWQPPGTTPDAPPPPPAAPDTGGEGTTAWDPPPPPSSPPPPAPPGQGDASS